MRQEGIINRMDFRGGADCKAGYSSDGGNHYQTKSVIEAVNSTDSKFSGLTESTLRGTLQLLHAKSCHAKSTAKQILNQPLHAPVDFVNLETNSNLL